MKGRKKE